MKKHVFTRSLSRFSPLKMWLLSQLIFWIPTLLALVADFIGRAKMGMEWNQGAFGVPTALAVVVGLFWSASIVLLVLLALDFARRRKSVWGHIAAVGMTVVTAAATYLAFVFVLIVYYMQILGLPH